MSHPAHGSAAMLKEDDSRTYYVLYLEFMGGLIPLLKGKRSSKLRTDFHVFDPQPPGAKYYDHATALDRMYSNDLPETNPILIDVVSNFFGTNYKMNGYHPLLPSVCAKVSYRTSLLHLQPRQLTIRLAVLEPLVGRQISTRDDGSQRSPPLLPTSFDSYLLSPTELNGSFPASLPELSPSTESSNEIKKLPPPVASSRTSNRTPVASDLVNISDSSVYTRCDCAQSPASKAKCVIHRTKTRTAALGGGGEFQNLLSPLTPILEMSTSVSFVASLADQMRDAPDFLASDELNDKGVQCNLICVEPLRTMSVEATSELFTNADRRQVKPFKVADVKLLSSPERFDQISVDDTETPTHISTGSDTATGSSSEGARYKRLEVFSPASDTHAALAASHYSSNPTFVTFKSPQTTPHSTGLYQYGFSSRLSVDRFTTTDELELSESSKDTPLQMVQSFPANVATHLISEDAMQHEAAHVDRASGVSSQSSDASRHVRFSSDPSDSSATDSDSGLSSRTRDWSLFSSSDTPRDDVLNPFENGSSQRGACIDRCAMEAFERACDIAQRSRKICPKCNQSVCICTPKHGVNSNPESAQRYPMSSFKPAQTNLSYFARRSHSPVSQHYSEISEAPTHRSLSPKPCSVSPTQSFPHSSPFFRAKKELSPFEPRNKTDAVISPERPTASATYLAQQQQILRHHLHHTPRHRSLTPPRNRYLAPLTATNLGMPSSPTSPTSVANSSRFHAPPRLTEPAPSIALKPPSTPLKRANTHERQRLTVKSPEKARSLDKSFRLPQSPEIITRIFGSPEKQSRSAPKRSPMRSQSNLATRKGAAGLRKLRIDRHASEKMSDVSDSSATSSRSNSQSPARSSLHHNLTTTTTTIINSPTSVYSATPFLGSDKMVPFSDPVRRKFPRSIGSPAKKLAARFQQAATRKREKRYCELRGDIDYCLSMGSFDDGDASSMSGHGSSGYESIHDRLDWNAAAGKSPSKRFSPRRLLRKGSFNLARWSLFGKGGGGEFGLPSGDVTRSAPASPAKRARKAVKSVLRASPFRKNQSDSAARNDAGGCANYTETATFSDAGVDEDDDDDVSEEELICELEPGGEIIRQRRRIHLKQKDTGGGGGARSTRSSRSDGVGDPSAGAGVAYHNRATELDDEALVPGRGAVGVRAPGERHSRRRRCYRYVELHNKPPVWNEAHQVYQLDFGGRVTQESAKNFQIEFEDTQVLQFGRVDSETYTLDFGYPFTAVQAFAVALANITQRLK